MKSPDPRWKIVWGIIINIKPVTLECSQSLTALLGYLANTINCQGEGVGWEHLEEVHICLPGRL